MSLGYHIACLTETRFQAGVTSDTATADSDLDGPSIIKIGGSSEMKSNKAFMANDGCP